MINSNFETVTLIKLSGTFQSKLYVFISIMVIWRSKVTNRYFNNPTNEKHQFQSMSIDMISKEETTKIT